MVGEATVTAHKPSFVKACTLSHLSAQNESQKTGALRQREG